jgi:rhamnosyltransferase
MISVVIRNKNEAVYLERTLKILTSFYESDIDEIILVDNQSTDTSLLIAKKYNCKIVGIEQFSYGKASNLGIEAARNNIILLLSSHVIPVGNSFFKNALLFIDKKKDWAGIRFINSIENFERALANNFEVQNPLDYGLMASCCLVSKKVWKEFKFDEELPFSEDKAWSQKVALEGYKIYDFNETFFYDVKRNQVSQLNRIKHEMLATYMLHENLKFPSPLKIVLSFFKKSFITNTIQYYNTFKRDVNILRIRLWIYYQLK